MKKNFDEYAINIYVTNITKWSAYLEKQLSHGKKYLAGDKMTIADFAAAASASTNTMPNLKRKVLSTTGAYMINYRYHLQEFQTILRNLISLIVLQVLD